MKISVFQIMLLVTTMGFTQPPIEWIRTYDNGAYEAFDDLYKITNDGYITSGYSQLEDDLYHSSGQILLTRLDNDGDVIWVNTYGNEDDYESAASIIDTDEGDFVVACRTIGEDERFNTVLKVNADGDLLWQRTYANGYSNAIIELKGGGYLVAGSSDSHGYLLSINTNGGVIWQSTYEDGRAFNTMRETEGGVVAAGYSGRNIWVIKADLDGELIWSRHYQIGRTQKAFGMVSSNGGGFAIAGSFVGDNDGNGTIRDCLLLKIDDDGNQEWSRTYSFVPSGNRNNESFRSIERIESGGYVMTGARFSADLNAPISLRVTSNGAERWRRSFRFDLEDPPGNAGFGTVIRGHDNSIMAAGITEIEGDSTLWNGIVIKLEPEMLQPMIFYYEPEDTVYSVLARDTTDFLVRARNQQGNEMFYLWLIGDDTLSIDTTVSIPFLDLGEYLVECQVSDGEFTSAVRWHVIAEEFFIDRHTPDSLNWSIRRPREVDFELGVRAIEGVEPQVRWILTGHRGAWEDVGDAPNLTYEFDRPGEYSLEGQAFHDGTVHSVTWQIAVRSVLYWWTPHERELTIDLHDEIEFNLLPFNPNSDSLDFRWLIDGEHDENELDAGLFYSFGDLGDHSVTAIVHDGAEVDTVIWSITVEDPNALEDSKDGLLPTEVTLYPAAPNPFNSTTAIRYFLPRSADVRLTVYDSAGRLVQTLSEGLTLAGENRATLQGSELPAGVYLLRLKTGDAVRSMKVVLLK